MERARCPTGRSRRRRAGDGRDAAAETLAIGEVSWASAGDQKWRIQPDQRTKGSETSSSVCCELVDVAGIDGVGRGVRVA